MFENEIKFISDFTLNKVKELGSFITVEKLLSTDIHPSIKKYVEGEVNYLISEDRKKLIENSLFDYSGKEISNYFDLIGAEIKKTKKISYEDIKNIVLQAVSFNANYVVRPKWSLSKLIFGNSKSVSINEIQLMFNYTYYYEYLNNVFLAYLSKKKILNISVTEFELIMNKIDRELFMLHQSKLVDNALYAIADYFSIGGLNKSSVTIESVENFLKEKNLTELLFKLKRAYVNSSKKKVDIDELRKILYSTFTIDSPFVQETEAEPEEVAQDEKHFENPLKDNFVADEIIEETKDQNILEVNNSTTNIDENEPIELGVKDLFIEDELTSDQEDVSKTELNIKTEPDVEKAIEQIEPQKFEIISDEEIKAQLDILEQSDFITDEEENSDIFNELEIQQEEVIENTVDETVKKTKIDEEELLANLTEEIEKSEDEEIIILDEKEQEDLLNFYDNELEISIDDDNNFSLEPKTQLDNEENSLDDLVELKFDHELLNQVEDNDDAVPLEKIDFIKDLTDENTDAENKVDAQPVLLKKKSEDIFSYLSNKEIDRIIKSLFNSDSEDFANTIEKMSDCSTYEDATHILDSIFKYARIKPHSKDAKLLSDAVAKYFNVDI
ncbi:MAG: hypothetical protein IPH97_07700 [Ignavibacteriales bacterium]|nr:hypothetical protein [Ignavibacteriales bacterium]